MSLWPVESAAMAARNGGSESSINLGYDPAERRDVESEITRFERLVAEIKREAAISREPDDYLDLSDALKTLASLYARKCFFISADMRRCHASIIAAIARRRPAAPDSAGESVQQQQQQQQQIGISSFSCQSQEVDDDWETLADNEAFLADLSLSPANAAVLEPPNEDQPVAPARRRGRGSFLYRTNELYSDQVDHDSDARPAGVNSSQEESGTVRNQQYGTGHVILLYDFPPTTRTTDLESLFENFREGGLAIRWVSDTVALAVFRTPSAAHEAQTGIEFPFKVRRLEEGGMALHKISLEDLELPAARPRTSASTARRMIGHAMGMEAGSSSGAGSEEFRLQEAARKDRLHQRHDMKDDAWGPDD